MSMMDKKITLRSVVTKIRNKSLQDHDGNIHDHVLEIFETLTEYERIVFIEDIVNMVTIAETRKSYEKSLIKYSDRKEDIPINSRKEDLGIIDLEKTLELENGRALINLKDWLIKAVVLSILVFLILAGICTIALQQGFELPSYLVYFKELYLILNSK